MRVEFRSQGIELNRDQRRYLRGTLRWALSDVDVPLLRVEANVLRRQGRIQCELEGRDAAGRNLRAQGRGHTFTEAAEMAANALSVAAFSSQREEGAPRRAA